MKRSLTTLLVALGTDSRAHSESLARAAAPRSSGGRGRVGGSRSPCCQQPRGDEAELEVGRGGHGGGSAGRGSASLWSQLLGRLRLEDRLSPGVLGCSALCRSGVHTKFGINVVTSRERGATGLPKEAIAGAPGGEMEDVDFLSGLELADLLDPR